MTTSSKPRSWRDVLPIHPAAELFPMMDADELKALGEDIRKNKQQHDVVLVCDGEFANGRWSLIDGRNRLDAMEMVGLPVLDKDGFLDDGVRWCAIKAAQCDPYAYVISANIHRRHLNVEQRQNLLIELIARSPTKSDRQIGKDIGVDHKTIARARTKGEDVGRIPHVETRTDSKGRQQRAHKPPTPPSTAPKATLIEAVFDKCVAAVTDDIAEAVDQLDDVGCVRLLEHLQSIIKMLLVTANKRAVESIFADEPPKAASPAPPATKPPQSDDGGIPEFLRRRPSPSDAEAAG
ncbi:hypothetical protein JQ595_27090 [Bradyrhizobium japonicum]|uniref:hypothetical protein n=1 Tax=Bradyrhizobium japonicum TaxID=375 RepID=UPI001BABCDAD|nr:hypothetical protein [Bradyrhizobium japonicum]MBR0732421.1 hypothetical protein [Bradyrhizobium japonicum]